MVVEKIVEGEGGGGGGGCKVMACSGVDEFMCLWRDRRLKVKVSGLKVKRRKAKWERAK